VGRRALPRAPGRGAAGAPLAKLRRIAKAYVAKYGEGWRLPGLDGVLTFEVTPTKAFGFGRRDGHIGPPMGEGEHFNQTRYRFQAKRTARKR
jgi:hypothetical protein